MIFATAKYTFETIRSQLHLSCVVAVILPWLRRILSCMASVPVPVHLNSFRRKSLPSPSLQADVIRDRGPCTGIQIFSITGSGKPWRCMYPVNRYGASDAHPRASGMALDLKGKTSVFSKKNGCVSLVC